jgi:hypothetical protein
MLGLYRIHGDCSIERGGGLFIAACTPDWLNLGEVGRPLSRSKAAVFEFPRGLTYISEGYAALKIRKSSL